MKTGHIWISAKEALPPIRIGAGDGSGRSALVAVLLCNGEILTAMVVRHKPASLREGQAGWSWMTGGSAEDDITDTVVSWADLPKEG